MQLNTRHIWQREQNIFGLMCKSQVRLAKQETTQESLSMKSSQKIINFMEHKPENTAPLMADLKSILNRNNITLNNAV